MIGVQRTIKQQSGRFRKKILEKIKDLFWHKKDDKFDELDQNWDD